MSWGKDKVNPCSSYADMLPQEWIKENNYIPDKAYITGSLFMYFMMRLPGMRTAMNVRLFHPLVCTESLSKQQKMYMHFTLK